jgi:hypothetical protein
MKQSANLRCQEKKMLTLQKGKSSRLQVIPLDITEDKSGKAIDDIVKEQGRIDMSINTRNICCWEL